MNWKTKIKNIKINRWALLISLLLVIVLVQSCSPGDCLIQLFALVVGSIIAFSVIIVVASLLPMVGPILGIIVVGYLFVAGCLQRDSGLYNGVNKSCGCSAFCENIKPENENK